MHSKHDGRLMKLSLQGEAIDPTSQSGARPDLRGVKNFEQSLRTVAELEQKWRDVKANSLSITKNLTPTSLRNHSAHNQVRNRQLEIFEQRESISKERTPANADALSLGYEPTNEPAHIIYDKYVKFPEEKFDVRKFSKTGDMRLDHSESNESESVIEEIDPFPEETHPQSHSQHVHSGKTNPVSILYHNKHEETTKNSNTDSKSETFGQKIGSLKSNPQVQHIFHEINSNLQKVFVNIRDLDSTLGSKDRSISRERTSLSINKILEKQRQTKAPSIHNVAISNDNVAFSPKSTSNHFYADRFGNKFCAEVSSAENNLHDKEEPKILDRALPQKVKVSMDYSRDEIADALKIIKHKMSEGDISLKPKQMTMSQVVETQFSSQEDWSKRSYNDDVKPKEKTGLEEIGELDRETENDYHYDSPNIHNLKAKELPFPSRMVLKNSASLDRKMYKKLSNPTMKNKGLLFMDKRTTEKAKESRISGITKTQKMLSKNSDQIKNFITRIEPLQISDMKPPAKYTNEMPRELSATRQLKEADSLSVNRPAVREVRNHSEQPVNRFISTLKLSTTIHNTQTLAIAPKQNPKGLEKIQEAQSKTLNNKKIASQLASNISRKITSKRYGDFGDDFEKRLMLKTPVIVKPRTSKMIGHVEKPKAEVPTCKVANTVQPYYKKIFPKCV
jgi:hypothetical protein